MVIQRDFIPAGFQKNENIKFWTFKIVFLFGYLSLVIFYLEILPVSEFAFMERICVYNNSINNGNILFQYREHQLTKFCYLLNTD